MPDVDVPGVFDMLFRRDGKPVDDGFTYTSGTNDQWLTKEQLVGMLP